MSVQCPPSRFARVQYASKIVAVNDSLISVQYASAKVVSKLSTISDTLPQPETKLHQSIYSVGCITP